MSQGNGTALKRKSHPALTAREALRKYTAAHNEGVAIDRGKVSPLENAAYAMSPSPGRGQVPWNALSDSWLGHKLRLAVVENDSLIFKLLLHHLLANIGAYPPPAGVFTQWPKTGRPGRPFVPEHEWILLAWAERGEPRPFSGGDLTEVAKSVYGAKYRDADEQSRKRLRDKCQKHVQRELERRAEQERTTAKNQG